MKEGYSVGAGDVRLAAQLLSQDGGARLRDYLMRAAIRGGKKVVVPRSLNQRAYLEQIDKHDMVFGIGPAGTGKTYLAVAQAVSSLLGKAVTRIILARPAVEAGEKLGFLPGDLQEKVDPYLRPLYDALYDLLDYEKVARLLERNSIEVAPIAFMRGRTLNDAFVIVDEAQNTTTEQMKMVLDPHRLRLQGRDHRRHHADRPAAGQDLGPGRGDLRALRRQGHRLRVLRREGRGPAPAGPVGDQGLRGLGARQAPSGRGPWHARRPPVARRGGARPPAAAQGERAAAAARAARRRAALCA